MGVPSGSLVTAGAAFGPWGAAAGAAAEVGMAVMDSGKAAAPIKADAIFGTNLQFDNSGWNVTFDGGAITSTSKKTTDQGGPSGLNSAQAGLGDKYIPYAILFVSGLIAWKMLKK